MIMHGLTLILHVMLVALVLALIGVALLVWVQLGSIGPEVWRPESDSAGRELPSTPAQAELPVRQPAAITATRILSPAEAREARETRHRA
jgi:hypothetical protein